MYVMLSRRHKMTKMNKLNVTIIRSNTTRQDKLIYNFMIGIAWCGFAYCKQGAVSVLFAYLTLGSFKKLLSGLFNDEQRAIEIRGGVAGSADVLQTHNEEEG